MVKGPETVVYSTTARAEVNSPKTTTTTTTKENAVIKFKQAIVSNYYKFKKCPWTIVVPDGFKSYRAPVSDVTIEIESGPSVQNMTLTRVIVGGALLGPVGAILGGMAKKDATHNNMVITFDAATIRIPFTNREYSDAQRFIEAVVKLQDEATR